MYHIYVHVPHTQLAICGYMYMCIAVGVAVGVSVGVAVGVATSLHAQ